MKTLHYNIYNNGNVGMCNVLMSVENALFIAKLTKREKIIFYCSNTLYNSNDKTIFDLYDIGFKYEVVKSDVINESIKPLEVDFFNTCLYYKEKPTKDFLNNRKFTLDLSLYEDLEEFRTLNNNTLAFYSYLFYIPDKHLRKELQDFVRFNVVPKSEYKHKASLVHSAIVKKTNGMFNGIAVRRGDYKFVKGTNNNNINLENITINLNSKTPLLVASDEISSEYFECLKSKFDKVLFVEDFIEESDLSAKGLITLIVMSNCLDFIGTMYSTFTAYIQRYRKYLGYNEEFKYLYSQNPSISLINNKMVEGPFGENTWTRLGFITDINNSAFWNREYPECYYNKKDNQDIKIVPDFLSSKDCEFIMSLCNNSEYFSNENRNRTVILINQYSEIQNIVNKACLKLGYNLINVEPSLQIFKQYKGGQTFLHCDSVHEDNKGKRIASVLFYLNDDFDGSYIDFPYIGLRISPKKGTMINYPLLNEWGEQDLKWAHSASVITKREKIMCYFSIKEK